MQKRGVRRPVPTVPKVAKIALVLAENHRFEILDFLADVVNRTVGDQPDFRGIMQTAEANYRPLVDSPPFGQQARRHKNLMLWQG